MKIYRFIVLFLIFYSCRSNTNSDKPQTISFYFRTQTGLNSYNFYSDNFVVNNYKKNMLTANELMRFAIAYLDTAKAEFPITLVNFIGSNAYGGLPEKKWFTTRAQKRFNIIAFEFKTNQGKLSFPLKLSGICIWKDGNPTFLFHNIEIDSLLNSKTPLDNEIN